MVKKIKIFLLIVCLMFLGAIIKINLFDQKENNIKIKKINKEKEIIDPVKEKVNNQIKNMTFEQKIAQMLILEYDKSYVDDNLISTLSSTSPGGFILMQQNITTYNNTKQLVNDMKTNSTIPLIISIDQEGGSVQRLNNLSDVKVSNIPYMYYLGKKNDKQLAYEVGKVIAEELKTIGVNVVFSPDIDIYSNKANKVIGKRSFSEDKKIVSDMANKVADGIESVGIIPTYKHFPGHGDTSVDSHKALPIINKTYEQLEDLELTTFKSAINNNAKIIMVGHIALPNITGSNIPSSLSKVMITDILKNKMKYNGLVITDALNMNALTNNYSLEEIYINSIEAGVDLLLIPKNFENAVEIIKNNVSEERINESVKKILYFKYKYLTDESFYDKSYLNSTEHQDIISEILY